MRCPSCGALETKRNGNTSTVPIGVSGPLRPLQRFLCRQCGASFTAGRTAASMGASFTDDFVLEAVRLYVQGLPSYPTLARLLEPRAGRPVSRTTLNRWVQRLGPALAPLANFSEGPREDPVFVEDASALVSLGTGRFFRYASRSAPVRVGPTPASLTSRSYRTSTRCPA